MDWRQLLQLAVAAALIIGGVLQMRRRAKEGSRTGSQGGVIMLAIGALVAIHGLGLMDYRPSPAEMERAR